MKIIILGMVIAIPLLFCQIIWYALHDDPYRYDWDGYEDYEDRIW